MGKKNQRKIDLLVIHCSATSENMKFTEQDLTTNHQGRGADGAGCHFYIRKNGDIKTLRPIEEVGTHTKGFDNFSIGICYEGGVDDLGNPKDTRTEWQKHSMRALVKTLLLDYPDAQVCGHRDLVNYVMDEQAAESERFSKICPSFDVRSDMDYIPAHYHYGHIARNQMAFYG